MRQIVYFSSAVRPMGDTDLTALLEQSRKNNLAFQITGLLFYVDQYFIQAIEGEDGAIEPLFHNIRADERNSDVTKLIDRDVEHRSFAGWLMGFQATNLAFFSEQPAFRNIRSISDLEAIERVDEALFSFMQAFYLTNAGPLRK